MSAFVEVRRARAVNFESFAHITATPLLDITATGLLFAADLTAAEAAEVWWFASSRDAADETARRAIAALLVDHTDPAVVALGNYVIGR